jgi:FkbM family methyltransferase
MGSAVTVSTTTMFMTIRGHTLYSPGFMKDPVVVDLGANHGAFSQALAARFGGRYWLVEANPVLAAALPAQSPFTVIHAAISDRPGTVTLHLAANDEGSSLLTLPEASEHNCIRVGDAAVPALTIANIIDQVATPIDILKIDIEGAEVEAFESLDLDRLEHVGQLTIEFHCDPAFGFGGQDRVERILDRLEAKGFLCLDFNAQRRIDVLAINTHRHAISWPRRTLLRLRYRPPVWLRRLRGKA